jgi:opacity protein-like surface antigen
MQIRFMYRIFLLAAVFTLGSAASFAQTDVAASLYGAFTGTSSANGVQQSPSNSAGGLIELRHISKPWLGYEGTYSYNRANQSYSTGNPPCPTNDIFCGSLYGTFKANAHEVTGDWIASVKLANLRPFALAGAGMIFDVPTSGQGNLSQCATQSAICISIPGTTSSSSKPVFVYGAGLDWGLLPHIGLRAQYRGNLYKAPNLSSLFTSTNKFTQTAEPMIGVYFRL